MNGKTYKVESTYFLLLRDGLQYTIEYPWDFRGAQGQMNHEKALKIAFPLMKHAYEKGLFERIKITKIGQGRIRPSGIGVVLFERSGGQASGYRVALSMDQIKRRIEQEAAFAGSQPARD